MKPLTGEMIRILHAIDDDRLRMNAGRWVIDGEPRPERRSRELLLKRGLVDYERGGGFGYFITAKGREALERVNA